MLMLVGVFLVGGVAVPITAFAQSPTQAPPAPGIQLPFNPHPDISQLPGGSAAQNLVNGLEAWVFVACLAGFIGGAATMGAAGLSRHGEAGIVGRRMMIYAFLGVIFTAATSAILQFALHIGSNF